MVRIDPFAVDSATAAITRYIFGLSDGAMRFLRVPRFREHLPASRFRLLRKCEERTSGW